MTALFSGTIVLWAKPNFARARVMLGKLYERLGKQGRKQVFREIGVAYPDYYAGKIEIAYFLRRIGQQQRLHHFSVCVYDHLKTFEKASVEQHRTESNLWQKCFYGFANSDALV